MDLPRTIRMLGAIVRLDKNNNKLINVGNMREGNYRSLYKRLIKEGLIPTKNNILGAE